MPRYINQFSLQQDAISPEDERTRGVSWLCQSSGKNHRLDGPGQSLHWDRRKSHACPLFIWSLQAQY